MDLKGTQTEQNLKKALAGESIARNRYTYFADKARLEGLDEIADILETNARNEKEHAFLWYKLLHGEPNTTKENLEIAAGGEHDEWTDMYRDFADIARKEGFLEISQLFTSIGRIERNHERLIRQLIRSLETNTYTDSSKESSTTLWTCGYCGFTNESEIVPDKCPICGHPPIAF